MALDRAVASTMTRAATDQTHVLAHLFPCVSFSTDHEQRRTRLLKLADFPVHRLSRLSVMGIELGFRPKSGFVLSSYSMDVGSRFLQVIDPIKDRMIATVWRVLRHPQDAEDALQTAVATLWQEWERINGTQTRTLWSSRYVLMSQSTSAVDSSGDASVRVTVSWSTRRRRLDPIRPRTRSHAKPSERDHVSDLQWLPANQATGSRDAAFSRNLTKSSRRAGVWRSHSPQARRPRTRKARTIVAAPRPRAAGTQPRQMKAKKPTFFRENLP